MEELQIAESAYPIISMLLGLVISLWIKDIAASFVKGLSFRLSPFCKEGELVIIDGEPAVVIKIGIRSTIFSIEKDIGVRAWRSVPNERIPYLRLEKIVPASDTNKFNKKSVDKDVV